MEFWPFIVQQDKGRFDYNMCIIFFISTYKVCCGLTTELTGSDVRSSDLFLQR